MRARLGDPEPEIERETDTLYIRAWHDLATCRGFGMAVGPIPFTAVLAWADFYELDRETTALLWDVLRILERKHAEREANRRAVEKARGK